jgi:uncharacterized protein (UPF0332 family)
LKEPSRKLVDKAARAIHAAEVLLAASEVDFAAGRAYYAMFYAAEALLYERGLRSRKHSGVHSLFGEHSKLRRSPSVERGEGTRESAPHRGHPWWWDNSARASPLCLSTQ